MTTCGTCGTALPPSAGRGRPRKFCQGCAKLSAAASKRACKRRSRVARVSLVPVCCQHARSAQTACYGSERVTYRDYAGHRKVTAHWNIVYYDPPERISTVKGAHLKHAKVRSCAQHKEWKAWKRKDRAASYAKKNDFRKGPGDTNSWEDLVNDGLVIWENGKRVMDSDVSDEIRAGRVRISMRHPDQQQPKDPPLQLLNGSKCGFDTAAERMTREFLRNAPPEPVEIDPVQPEDLTPHDIEAQRKRCADVRRWHMSPQFAYSYYENRGGRALFIFASNAVPTYERTAKFPAPSWQSLPHV